ncbi:HD domain-containing protein [Aminipila luticellarii]|uniref:HD domain-containing protein n=1 Tax=Aminipila luticellarii TaxID=2507160 RepID=A0A410PVT3_9FIRM|nr:HD domain-containing protein [Aminipila luticellarii]QAT43028.1 HD domain-containing protein [Aminipila luticellarii]
MFDANIDRSYVTTYYKRKFNPTRAAEKDITIGDVAHALSLICRANGHLKIFFSVAQHSINCALEARERGLSQKIQLDCLLHDASEAYIGDVITPLKIQLSAYKDYERELQATVLNALDVEPPNETEEKAIKEIDSCMLYHEFKLLHGDLLFKTEPEIHISICESEVPHAQVEAQFIQLYRELKTY